MRSIAICGVLILATSCGGKKDDEGGDKKERKGKRDRGDDDDDGDRKPRRRKGEAPIHLEKISMRAKEEAVTTGSFPVAKIALTPATNCCEQNYQNKRKCSVVGADWTPWSKLDFSIDEPFYFQYSYESDGKTFIAKAVGDLDCDATTITYEVRGTLENGNPQIELVAPPPNTD